MFTEIIAKVAAAKVYDEKLVKPAMVACANEVLGKDAESVLSTIPFSNDTITKRQDELSNIVEEKMVEILKKTKFSIQVDKTTIHNQAILLVFVRFINEDEHIGRLARMSDLDTEVDGSNPGSSMLFP